ncbi:MAG TPA: DUF1080 domain-containing protein [Planctomycetota bacterium]|nr:DUF1080 domain-containing protein [Planctomycetota bacterium]
MKSLFLFAVCALLFSIGSRAEEKGEWRALFNGKDTSGWEHVGGGGFVVEDGLLKTQGGMGLLWYTGETFENCVIRVVYKVAHEASNGGIFVRIAEKPKDAWYAVHHGYEIQICNKQDEYHRTGAIYSLSKATAEAAKAPGEWNTMEITLKGPKITVVHNGTQVNDFDPAQPVPERKKNFEPERGPRPERGYIGLQNHDDYAKGSIVFYKEVSVKKL